MDVEIHMPAVAESMTEGTLARWLKRVGEAVAAGEAIAEVESDKATVELEAPRAGVITELRVLDGTVGVKVGSVIALLAGKEEGAPLDARAAPPPDGSPTAASPGGRTGPRPDGAGRPRRVFASPAARRLARDHGIDLSALRGSGPGGRIVMGDVAAAAGTSTAVPRSVPTPIPPPAPSSRDGGDLDEIPHNAMRRVTAQRLTEAKQTIPHFYLTVDCRLDELLALRRQINACEAGLAVSITDLVVKAAALALRKVPAVNASWSDAAVLQHRRVDISVAVATRRGLITPVVRDADAKSLRAISAEVRSLAERARDQRLSPHEYQGGGFSISNLGMHGVREFAAIINPPQACILAVGAGEPRPVVRDGAVAIATVMTCTLSADHRVVDGVTGAEFLGAFRALVERPLALLV